jgi:hypothetical protein
MDYHSMDIVDLKYHARLLNIKQYYIKRKAELIQILSYKSLPEKYILEKKTILELRDEARVRGFGGILKMSRQQLIDILYPTVKG